MGTEHRGVDLFALMNTLDSSQGSTLESNAHGGYRMQMGHASNPGPQQVLRVHVPVGSGGSACI